MQVNDTFKGKIILASSFHKLQTKLETENYQHFVAFPFLLCYDFDVDGCFLRKY